MADRAFTDLELERFLAEDLPWRGGRRSSQRRPRRIAAARRAAPTENSVPGAGRRRPEVGESAAAWRSYVPEPRKLGDLVALGVPGGCARRPRPPRC